MKDVDYLEMNRIGWDRRARAHVDSAFYDVQGFLAGRTSLREIELEQLGSVAGRRLLHLQCHFGLDTLSWARMGAQCTGVDLSPVAIELAEELRQKTGLDARFVCSDVYAFQRPEADPYDIVFTSYGAICWLPNLDRWARMVSENLRPGGTFNMVEFHPVYDLLAGDSYFSSDRPYVAVEETYTENRADAVAELATWTHPLSDVLGALTRSGIQINQFHEFPFSPYNCFPDMEQREPGRFYVPHRNHDIPLVYSLKGQKT